MKTASFNLRNISPEILEQLKFQAKSQQISVNQLILCFIQQNLGIVPPRPKQIFHDLDHLSGTWSSSQVNEFQDSIKSFEEIDSELWK